MSVRLLMAMMAMCLMGISALSFNAIDSNNAANVSIPMRTLTSQCASLCRGVRPPAHVCIPYGSDTECRRHIRRSNDVCSNQSHALCMTLEDTQWKIGLGPNESLSALYFGGVLDTTLQMDRATVVFGAPDFDRIDPGFRPDDDTRTLRLQALGAAKTLGLALSTEMLRQWTMLEKLSLRGLDLSRVDTLPLFPRLVDLDLTRTKLSKFPFEQAPVLSTLTLSHNDLRLLNLTAVPQNLRSLDLEDCGLTKMPVGIDDLSNLDILQLSGNNFAQLQGVPAWNQLSSLNMSKTQWDHFPTGISKMKTLKILDLSFNPIPDVPRGSLPPSLTQVSLANCNLVIMPADINRDGWTSINLAGNAIFAAAIESTKATTQHLSLASMGLTKTPNLASFWKITGTLDLSANPIGNFDTRAVPLAVTSLILNNCSLKSVPSDLKVLSDLDQLSMSHNTLGSITAGMLPTLRSLNASYCGLKEVPSDVIKMKDSLEELDLSGNTIVIFNWSFPNLEVLRLSGNGLTSLPPMSGKFRELDLRGNSIRNMKITKEQYAQLGAIARLLIDTDMLARCDGSKDFLLGVPVCLIQDSGLAVNEMSTSAAAISKKATTPWPVISACLGALCILIGVVVIICRPKSRKNMEIDKNIKTSNNKEEALVSCDGSKATGQSNSRERQGTTCWEDDDLLKWRVDYQLIEPIEELASGAFGVVWKARYLGELVVTKQLHERLCKREAILDFIDEIRFMANFEHPKIVRFIGAAWTMESNIKMILEYMSNNDVWSYLKSTKNSRKIWTRQKLSIALDIAEALVYLHSLDPKVIHRDLKAKNVLLDDKMTAKLGDFGVSRKKTGDDTMTAGVGTSRWMAPEVIVGESWYSEAVDIYSYGIVMIELDTHNLPFANARNPNGSKLKETTLMDLLSRGEIHPPLSQSTPPELKTTFQNCLSYDPKKRPTAVQIAFVLRRALKAMDEQSSNAKHTGSKKHRW